MSGAEAGRVVDGSELAVGVFLHFEYHVCDLPGLLDDLLEEGGQGVVFVGAAEDLSDLLESEALLSRPLEESRADADVPEADGAEVKDLLDGLNIPDGVDLPDVGE